MTLLNDPNALRSYTHTVLLASIGALTLSSRASGRRSVLGACALAGLLSRLSPMCVLRMGFPLWAAHSVCWETWVIVFMTALGFSRTLTLHVSGHVGSHVTLGKWKV